MAEWIVIEDSGFMLCEVCRKKDKEQLFLCTSCTVNKGVIEGYAIEREEMQQLREELRKFLGVTQMQKQLDKICTRLRGINE